MNRGDAMSGHGGMSRISSGGAAFKQESKEYAEEIIKHNSIVYQRESVQDIKKFFKEVAQTKDGVVVDDDGYLVIKKEVGEKAKELAEKLADRIRFTDEEAASDYKDLKDSLSGKYKVTDDTKGEFGSSSEWRKYQKNSQVDVVLSSTAKDSKTGRITRTTELDSKYKELYNEGANRYGLTGKTSNSEQLKELNETLTRLRSESRYGIYNEKARVNTGGLGPQQTKNYLRNELLRYSSMAQLFYESGSTRRGRGKKK